MIKLDRSKAVAPANLVKNGPGELQKYLDATAKKKKFKFTAYSDEPVKDALKVIFGRKCGFCESLILGTQSGDVEHYRPKGAVVVTAAGTGVQTQIAGYYWLAAEWSNLLLSCADCNRPRTQYDFDGSKRVIGKANFFPLESEAQRATTPAMIAGEEPLLLDPCSDDPEKHIEFTDEGGVKPISVAGIPSPKGVATIHYFGLARAELLQMRARHRRLVISAIRHIVTALEAKIDPGADLDDLVEMLDPKEPYVAFTRYLVRNHLKDYLLSLGLEKAVV